MPKVIDEAKVFKAVIDLLALHGYEGTTTKEIAEMAGINEATLFRKYRNKTELIEQAIQHQLADTPLNRLVYTGDLESDLLAIVEAYLETNELYGEIIPTLLAELPRHPELKGSFQTPWENIQVVIEILQEYQGQGKLKAESPLASLNALIGPLMTSQIFRRADLGFSVPVIDAREHVNAFFHGRNP
jgi:AcrR family transcriptional regulator